LLKHLTIRNFALIEKLDADFFEGFSVMTGETGAGKSIILGALSLIMGNRADLQSIKDNSKKCVIEGVFQSDNFQIRNLFEDYNLDYDPDFIILRREILPSGKSRSFVNDTPVGLSDLKTIANHLIDIHTQNSAILLQDSEFQLKVLDGYAQNEKLLHDYKALFAAYSSLKTKLKALLEKEQKTAAEQDFLKFQFDELEKAQLLPTEQHQAETELEILNHAGEIKAALYNAGNLIDSENGLLNVFRDLMIELKSLKTISSAYEELFQRVESNFLDIKDIFSELTSQSENLEVNPEKIEDLTERLNLIYHLQQKHRVDDVASLIKIKNDLTTQIAAYHSLATQIDETRNQLAKIEVGLKNKAGDLTKIRQQAKPQLEEKILTTIKSLGMPEANIEIELITTNDFSETGQEKVKILFNANKGGRLMEMAKVASGGELSRLMLAIKANVAFQNLIHTIIFDEIDSGVSGEIAGKMAVIMQQLGQSLQVISITHLPQIAAKGSYHYLVRKNSAEDTTITSLQLLNSDERLVEIAKMLSDTKVTTPALEAAKALLFN
jgi:DNA repair protein RecN (Recombination protein N)